MNKGLRLLYSIGFFIIFSCVADASQNHIIVDKKNVRHVFVPFDQATDHFVKNVFASWENETFEIFDEVKDPEGIAIDLGAWIGVTTIWCAKNFNHVVAVDADQVSLQCLKNNLEASQCENVTICSRPVSNISKQFVFGPRGAVLNESISYIKDEIDNVNDYSVKGITFKQLIHDYVYKNETIKNKKISFIKCDIEGGEENILEDLLCFAYHNKTKAYISFHLDWWKTYKISDFEYLFKFFKTNCPDEDVLSYIKKNPFTSILFEPLDNGEVLIKKNMPVVIIGYNQLTFIKNMIAQLEKYTTDIILIDNNSSYDPLLNYYINDFKYTLLRQDHNYGHAVVYEDFIQNLVGDIYLVTDPDLQFNNKLPDNFIDVLLKISNHFGAYKVGFALFIDSDQIRTDKFFLGQTVKEWEIKFWQKLLKYNPDNSLMLYEAIIDTTFCLINKKFISGSHVRVGGDYTCVHIPWLKDFKDSMMPDECEAYLKNNLSTTWF